MTKLGARHPLYNKGEYVPVGINLSPGSFFGHITIFGKRYYNV
jgi:hypothetical protein